MRARKARKETEKEAKTMLKIYDLFPKPTGENLAKQGNSSETVFGKTKKHSRHRSQKSVTELIIKRRRRM